MRLKMPKPHVIYLAAARKRRTRRKTTRRRARRSEWLEDIFSELGVILTWMGIGMIIAVASWLFVTIEMNDATVINQRAWKLAEFFGYQPPAGANSAAAQTTTLTEDERTKQRLLASLERTLRVYQEMDWENMTAAKRRHFELQRQLLQHQADTLRRELQ